MTPTTPRIYSLSKIQEEINDAKKFKLPEDFFEKVRNYLGEDEDPEFGRIKEVVLEELEILLRGHKLFLPRADLHIGIKNIKARLTKIIKASSALHNQLVDTDEETRRLMFISELRFRREVTSSRNLQEKKNGSKQGMNSRNEAEFKLPCELTIELCSELIEICKNAEKLAEKDPKIRKSTRGTTNQMTSITLDYLSNFFDQHQIMPYFDKSPDGTQKRNKQSIQKINKNKRDFLDYCIGLVSKRFSKTKIKKLTFRPKSTSSTN